MYPGKILLINLLFLDGAKILDWKLHLTHSSGLLLRDSTIKISLLLLFRLFLELMR